MIYSNNIYQLLYSPVNKEELFNLRHASARNAIERIFGIFKRRFRILLVAPEFNLDIQARIPAALAAVHNFIRTHNPQDHINTHNFFDPANYSSHRDLDYHASAHVAASQDRSTLRRDQIAQQMWDDYQRILEERLRC